MATPIKYGKLTVTPFMPEHNFGAEVEGVDFSAPIPADVLESIVAIQDKYAVTAYRSTGLDDDGHVAFSMQLGELEPCPRFTGPDILPRFDNPWLFDVGNLTRDGGFVKQNTRRWWYNKGNNLPHTDSSFNQYRAKYSILLAHEIPASGGGDTEFYDTRTAYNDLPESTKEQIKDLVVEHDLWHSRKLAAPEEYADITETEKAAKKPAFHKLVQKAPDGRDTLYIAAHAKTIVGWPEEKGFKLITELVEHCTQPKYHFSLKWKNVGDMVIWDNRQSMHSGSVFSDQMERRDMRRTTVFDDGPYKDGVSVGADLPAA